jgi:hypothetical protein
MPERKEYKVRPLIQRDRVTLAAMIRKLVEKVGTSDLLNIMVRDEKAIGSAQAQTPGTKAETPKDKFTKLGIKVINLMIDAIEEDLRAWFADLIGVTPEAFQSLPIDIEIRIINQLMDAPEANDFFAGALRLSKKMQGFAGKLKPANGP